MDKDFKLSIVRLLQHPIFYKPISELSDIEQQQAYELIKEIIDLSVNEKYTKLDYFQMARLQYQLGELAFALDKDREEIIKHYRKAPYFLNIAGIDLSLKKWFELLSLPTEEQAD